MALGIKTQSNEADFLPRIQYDARAGRFFKIERTNDGGTWISVPEEMPLPVRMAMDLENLEVGWIKLASPPDFRMVKLGQPLPPDPGIKAADGKPMYKQGFRCMVFNKAIGVRLWNHTAQCVLEQVDALHDQWLAAKDANPGKVPVVAIGKTAPRVSGKPPKQSTNYAPLMTIEQWIARPPELDATGGEVSGNGHANGHANGNGHAAPAATVPPPVGQTNAMPPQLAEAGADDALF